MFVTGPTIDEQAKFFRSCHVKTTGFPKGRYRYYIEFKDDRSRVIQVATVDFELK